MNDLYDYIDRQADAYIEMLRRLLRQPSVAAQDVGMEATATLVKELLDGVGAEARLYDTRGGYPVVYGEIAGAAPKTLSFYNHYDVQPPEPLELWESDPWAAEIRDGQIWARGASDNKGNLAARIAAVDAYRKLVI